MEDKKIIALYLDRDTAAIERSSERYGAYCKSIAWNILGCEQDAEECVNDTWLRAWNSIPPMRPDNLAAYLGKLTRTAAIDRQRAMRREKRGGGSVPQALEEIAEIIPDGTGLDQELMRGELIRAINRFLSRLSETERNVFLCRYWYFEDVSDICSRFDFSRSKVDCWIRRRTTLRSFAASPIWNTTMGARRP